MNKFSKFAVVPALFLAMAAPAFATTTPVAGGTASASTSTTTSTHRACVESANTTRDAAFAAAKKSYETAVTAAKTTRDSALDASKTKFNKAKTDAKTARDASVALVASSTDKVAKKAAMKSAEETFEAAMSAAHTDLTAARKAARDAYKASIKTAKSDKTTAREAVLVDGTVGRRAQRVEDKQHFVFFHQLAGLLNRFGRVVAVVQADEVDLATVDAALIVDLGEVGRDGLADGAVGRRRTRVRADAADLDLFVGGAGVVLLLCHRGRADGQGGQARKGEG